MDQSNFLGWRQGKSIFIGSRMAGKTGAANENDRDDSGMAVYVYIDPNGKFAIQSDVPGADMLKGANPNYFPYEYLANFYAVAVSGKMSKDGSPIILRWRSPC